MITLVVYRKVQSDWSIKKWDVTFVFNWVWSAWGAGLVRLCVYRCYGYGGVGGVLCDGGVI